MVLFFIYRTDKFDGDSCPTAYASFLEGKTTFNFFVYI